MEQGLKERLIGAAVLVALGVWLIPWLLDGPADSAEARRPALELPVPDGAAADADLKTEVIDLSAPQPPSPAGASGAGASIGSDAAASALAKQDTAAKQATAQEFAGVDAEVAELEAAKLDAAKNTAASTVNAAKADAARAESTKAAAEAERAKAAAAKAEAEKAEAAKAAKAAAAKAEAAKVAKASSAGIAAPAAKGDWAIQLGSFGDKENAERLAARVTAFGVKPRITTYRADGRLMYRVRLGPYETRAKADAAASGLGAHGFVAQVVTAG